MKSSPSIKRVHIDNLGCAKNQVDAEYMIAALEKGGYLYTDNPDEADAIIVNSCAFILPAKRETIDHILEWRSLYPQKKIVLAGCFARRYHDQAAGSMHEIDASLENDSPRAIVPRLDALFGRRGTPENNPGDEIIRTRLLGYRGSAYVKISEGCRHFCTYCAIPIIRGPLQSRTVKSVVDEILRLLESGVFEINLIAQDLASFGVERGSPEFMTLLHEIARVKADFWIRFLYIHPDNFPPDLPEFCRQDSRFLPYFDIPFQHASAKILSAMGRRGSAREYLELVGRIRSSLPHSVIRSTFMVGFPGESVNDYRALLDFQREAALEWVGFFVYSREEGTRAYSMTGPLRMALKKGRIEERKRRLEEIQTRVTAERLTRFIGSRVRVLVEEGIKGGNISLARSYINAPEVDGLVVVKGIRAESGELRMCRITGLAGIDLLGAAE